GNGRTASASSGARRARPASPPRPTRPDARRPRWRPSRCCTRSERSAVPRLPLRSRTSWRSAAGPRGPAARRGRARTPRGPGGGADRRGAAGGQVVNGTGMHLTPGIIDCHSHIATDGGVNEAGQAVSAEVRIGDFIDPNDMAIYRQLGGGVTEAHVLHGSANP